MVDRQSTEQNDDGRDSTSAWRVGNLVPWVHVPEEVGVRLLSLAEHCRALVAAWFEIGPGLAVPPVETSPAGLDARQFRQFKADGPDNVEFGPGQQACLYVDAIGQQLLAIEALLRARRVVGALWPIVRAQLEVAGRVAWLLDPEVSARSGEVRVARLYLEVISSIQRERFTASKFSPPTAKKAKEQRDKRIAEARAIFGDFDLDLAAPQNMETWTIHDQKLPGLGAGVDLFIDLCLGGTKGLYDFLSDYSHPSLLTAARQTARVDAEGVSVRPWVIPGDVIEHQVRLACLILYKSCHLVAGYYALDDAALESWADTVPDTWFPGEGGTTTE